MDTTFVLAIFICRLLVTFGLTFNPTELLRLEIDGQLTVDSSDIEAASHDFGGINRVRPLAVLHPASAEDVAQLVRAAYELADGFTVSARGYGHSINAQSQTSDGVVIEMSGGGSGSRAMRLGLQKPAGPRVSEKQRYVDVWGGELWIDVLKSTLEYGLAPKSWTDYLYLSVGGTLSNAGISGHTFNHGPQISNVFEVDVVTGKGELLRCSEEENTELFHGVLGGLGQFGIITRARIALEPAPKMVRWIRVLYSNFSEFTHDQEYLISLHGQPSSRKFNYVEGFLIMNARLLNDWRLSFSSPSNRLNISSLSGLLYCLAITKNYDDSSVDTLDQEVEGLMQKLKFIPASEFTTDLPYLDFLDRAHKAELKLRSMGLWEVPHPWLNLFVPKSRIADFDKGVFKGILGNNTSGTILIYPMNKNKWDERSSVVTPEEEVFYVVTLAWSAFDKSGDETQTLEYLTNRNRQILKFCDDVGIKVKQYLPHYTSQLEWMDHFGGDKWALFHQRKMKFDPKRILATRQCIFKPDFMMMHNLQARVVAGSEAIMQPQERRDLDEL